MHCADCGIYDTGYDPYSGDTAFLGKIVRGVAKVARKTVLPVMATERAIGAARSLARGGPKALLPLAIQALPHVQQAMKSAGPLGMLASGAAGALVAVVQGKSLENVAWAAAEGATPPGIDRALMAAKALREGKPAINVAVNAIRQSFPSGSPAQRAFDLGIASVKGGSKGMLANARGQLGTAAQKAAFDAAVGTVSKAAANLPTAGAGPRITMPKFTPRAPLSLLRPATNQALSIMRRNPQFARMAPGAFANRFGIPMRRVLEARGIIEASGVVEVGLVTDKLWVYTLKAGDTGATLAARFTGDANRWRELPKVNKRGMGGYSGAKDMIVKQTTTTIKGKKVPVTLLDPFFSGLKINLPGDWNGGAYGLPSITTGTPGAEPPVTTIPEVVVTPGPVPTVPTVPVSTPPVVIPPVTTPPVALPPPLPPIPPVSTPPVEIPGTVPVSLPPPVTTPTTPPIVVTPPAGGPPVTIPPVAVPTVPTPTTPAEEKKKKDATALGFGLAAAAAFMLL